MQTKNIIPVTKEKLLDENLTLDGPGGLVTFPAQCNYNGFKYPLELISKFQKNRDIFVCLDAASFLSTNQLDLQRFKPDFVCLSFYKIFGYPTGLGALIVSNRGASRLVKKYYGGGTVNIALTRTNFHQKRDILHERFEDGTISFLSIIALQSSFLFMENLLGLSFAQRISRHVFNLGRYLHNCLKNIKHHNGRQVVAFHHDADFEDIAAQGGIINFSLRHADNSFVGFAEFASIATLHNIILRTGCFCNPGSCQSHLNLTNDDLMQQFNAGHKCGDNNDLIDGLPTGSIRVSFGYMTTKENVDRLVEIIRECYAESATSGREKLENKLEKNFSKPYLKSIRIYPIKSCGAMEINDSWQLTNRGFKYDRVWMIINGNNGTCITQKNETRLCMLSPTINEAENKLRISFPGAEHIEIPLQSPNQQLREAKICETKVCGDRIQGYDCGNSVAQWLSDVLLMEDIRLIRQSENQERRHGEISFSNQAQFLLVSEPSVKWLMDEVDTWDDSDKDLKNIVNRFRGNLIIDNLEPLAESKFTELSIGRARFEIQGPCTRCQMICIDQATGEKTTEPLRTIGKLFKGKMKFGVYLKHSNVAEYIIKCGEEMFYK